MIQTEKRFFSILAILVLLVTVFHPLTVAVACDQQPISVPATSESPKTLILGAITQIDICNGAGSDRVALDAAKRSLSNSVARDFWDDAHVVTPLAFANHLVAVDCVESTKAYRNSSSPDHQAAASSVIKVVQADRGLADASITNGCAARSMITDRFTLSLMNSSLDAAKRDFNRSQAYLNAGDVDSAIQSYGASWTEANTAIALADLKTTPSVRIVTPASGAFLNTPTVPVAGSVNEVALYTIGNVSIDVNGNCYTSPLQNGQYSRQARLKEGNNTITVTAADIFCNKGSATSRVVLDTVKPLITVNGVADGSYYNTTVQPAVTVTDLHLQSSTVTLDGAPFNNTAVSVEGSHLLTVQAADLAGNTAGTTVSFVVDKTAPTVTIYGVQPGSYLGKTVLISGLITDANPRNLSLRVDGTEVSTTLPYAWDTSTYPDGNHTVTLTAVDKAGNQGSSSLQVVVDNTPPTVKFVTPMSGSIFSAGPISFLWSGTDNYGIAFYELLFGDRTYRATSTSQTVDSIPDGSYQITLNAYDLANNTATDRINLTVDTVPPAINVTGITEGGYYNYNVTPLINVTDANLNSTVVTLNGTAYNGETVTEEGNYTLNVYADDLAGNNATRELNFTIDKTAPGLVVNELTLNPNILNLTYLINGTVEPGALLTINNVTIVQNGSFVYSLNMSLGVNPVNVSATDKAGNIATWNRTRLIDGDLLPDWYEINVTHTDPLLNDTDGNGTADDYEDPDHDGLINVMEFLLGTDPNIADTDGDSLPDSYEVMVTQTSPLKADTNANNVTDANEDPDHDGLTNLQEYKAGTNPNVADTDGDGLNDSYELTVSHTNPLSADSDSDGLTDDEELKLGTNPNNPDSDGDGVPDSAETFTTSAGNSTLGINVSVTGKGDLSRHLTFVPEESPYLTNNSALVSPLVRVDLNGTFDSAIITMNYDPTMVMDPANLSLCYYNESLGLFLPVNSTVDLVNHTVSARATHFSLWGIFNLNTLSDIYTKVNNFNSEIAGYFTSTTSIPSKIVYDVSAAIGLTKTYTIDPNSNVVKVNEKVIFPGVHTTTLQSTPTPSPSATPTPTAQPSYAPIDITMNNKGQTNWFGNGASFPAGMYQINATGWYTHWSPVPTELACIDQGPDRGVRMYAWSSRGTNAVLAGSRMGMHLKFGQNDTPIYMVRVKPELLQFNHTGGQIGLWDNDVPYEDNTYQLHYVLSLVSTLPQPTPDMTDSDSDGLPDYVETHGFMDTQGNLHTTLPDKADTDNDGLKDGEEVHAYNTLNGVKYVQDWCDPNNPDSDNDGLKDGQEVHGSLIRVVDSRDKALLFYANQHNDPYQAVDDILHGYMPGNLLQYSTQKLVTSNPIEKQSDADGIPDDVEIQKNLDPRNTDSDGDHITDNVELADGGDPTVFDTAGPTGKITSIKVDTNQFSTSYTVVYTVSDDGGVARVSMLKNNEIVDSQSYTDRRTSVQRPVAYTTNPFEQLMDDMRTPTLTISSVDSNDNPASQPVYKGSSSWTKVANLVGADNPGNIILSIALGYFSGLSNAAVEFPELGVDFWNDPIGFINGIQRIIGISKGTIWLSDLDYSSPEKFCLSLGREMLPNYGDLKPTHNLVYLLFQKGADREELDNPYPSGSTSHYEFAGAWTVGFVVPQLILLLDTGGAATGSKGIKTGEDMAKAEAAIDPATAEAAADIASESAVVGAIEETKISLLDDAKALDAENGVTMVKEAETGTKAAEVIEALTEYDSLSAAKQAALAPYKMDAERFLLDTSKEGIDGRAFIEGTDTGTLQNMFSMKKVWGYDSDIKMANDLSRFRVGLAKLKSSEGITPEYIAKYVNNYNDLKDLEHSKKFLDAAANGNDVTFFRATAWEAERAVYIDGLAKKVGQRVKLDDYGGEIDASYANNFFEQKKAEDVLTERKLNRYLRDSEGKFELVKTVSGKQTKVEIDARDGLGDFTDESARAYVSNYVKNYCLSKGVSNNIDIVEIFKNGDTTVGSIKVAMDSSGNIV